MEDFRKYDRGSLEDKCSTVSKLIREDPVAAVIYLANVKPENMQDVKPAYVALKDALEMRYAKGQAEAPDEAKAYITQCLLQYVNQKIAELDGKTEEKRHQPAAGAPASPHQYRGPKPNKPEVKPYAGRKPA